jgi:hypothetical protein
MTLKDDVTDISKNKPHWAEKATVLLTLAIVLVGIIQACIYQQQKRIMESSGKQTQQLIDAANIQASAAIKNTEAAQQNAQSAVNFASYAKGINEHTEDAVKQFKIMAKASENSITATQQAIRLEQRAWLFVGGFMGNPKAGDVFAISTIVTNSGKTPARKVALIDGVSPRAPSELPDFDYTRLGPNFATEGKGILPPNGSIVSVRDVNGGQPLNQSELDLIDRGGIRFYKHGKISYEDVFGCQHWVRYCYYLHRTNTGEYQYHICDANNEMDDNTCSTMVSK